MKNQINFVGIYIPGQKHEYLEAIISPSSPLRLSDRSADFNGWNMKLRPDLTDKLNGMEITFAELGENGLLGAIYRRFGKKAKSVIEFKSKSFTPDQKYVLKQFVYHLLNQEVPFDLTTWQPDSMGEVPMVAYNNGEVNVFDYDDQGLPTKMKALRREIISDLKTSGEQNK